MSLQALPKGPGTRTFSGARAVLMYNGAVIGFASGCDGTEEIMYEPVEVLNKLEVAEHVPVGYRVSFRARIFRTIARGGGLAEENPGSMKEMGVFPKLDEILTVEGVEAVLIDSLTKKVVSMVQGCKASTLNWDVAARGIVAQDVQFVAIRMKDESEVKGAVATTT